MITVAIPFLNAQSSLLDAIRSIFSQTVRDWELLLIDDGSTDESLRIARSIDDPRVKVFSDGRNRNLAARLNQIIKLAEGEYIARMDADDLSHPERFARQLEFLDSHKDVDVVGTSMVILDKQGQPIRKIVVTKTHEDICRNKYQGFSMAHATVMAKARWFHRNLYNEASSRSQDFELWLQSYQNSTFANIVELLYFCNEFVSYKLSKYAKSKFTVAKTIWKYSPKEFGKVKAAYYSSICCAHIGAYALAKAVRLHNIFIQSRYLPLSYEEYAKVRRDLDIIRTTNLPLQTLGLENKPLKK